MIGRYPRHHIARRPVRIYRCRRFVEQRQVAPQVRFAHIQQALKRQVHHFAVLQQRRELARSDGEVGVRIRLQRSQMRRECAHRVRRIRPRRIEAPPQILIRQRARRRRKIVVVERRHAFIRFDRGFQYRRGKPPAHDSAQIGEIRRNARQRLRQRINALRQRRIVPLNVAAHIYVPQRLHRVGFVPAKLLYLKHFFAQRRRQDAVVIVVRRAQRHGVDALQRRQPALQLAHPAPQRRLGHIRQPPIVGVQPHTRRHARILLPSRRQYLPRGILKEAVCAVRHTAPS